MSSSVSTSIKGSRSRLEIECQKFLRSHLDPSRPLLLGLSGGADSITLFHQLLRYRAKWGLEFSVVHVDHAWRVESATEAKALRALVEASGVRFHGVRLSQVPSANWEEEGRRARLRAFRRLQGDHGYQAVVLGHHGSDQAETVLKRLLEGAGICALRGLEADREVEGVRLWRPLLTVSKEDILNWLRERGLTWWEDASNQDRRFQRNRFRHDLWPALEQAVGKRVDRGLRRLADEAQELRNYLDDRVAPHMEAVSWEELGWSFQMDPQRPLPRVEARHFIRRIFTLQRLRLSADILEKASSAWVEGQSEKAFAAEGGTLWVRGARLQFKKAVPSSS